MPRDTKTDRTTATIRAADLAQKLRVDRRTVYSHIQRLGIDPRRGPHEIVLLTPGQATAITQSIQKTNPIAGTIPIDGDRAAILIGALNTGKNTLDLVMEHKATPTEAEEIWRWWTTQTQRLCLTQDDLAKLSDLLDGSTITSSKVLLSLVHMRGCCRECAAPSLYCAACRPHPRTNGHAASSAVPVPPVPSPLDRVAADEAAFQARHAEALKRATVPKENDEPSD